MQITHTIVGRDDFGPYFGICFYQMMPLLFFGFKVVKTKPLNANGILNNKVSGLQPFMTIQYDPVCEISNNVVCATSKASDQPAHTCSLIRAFASGFSIL